MPDVAAGDHEKRKNEVAGGEPILANEPSNRFVLTEPSSLRAGNPMVVLH